MQTKSNCSLRVLSAAQNGGYTQFLIQGSYQGNSISIHKRYSDFGALQKLLEENWRGVMVPRLPEKKLFEKKEQSQEQRVGRVDWLVRGIGEKECLWGGETFRVWLKSQQFEKEALSLPKVQLQKSLQNYQKHFSEFTKSQQSLGNIYPQTLKSLKRADSTLLSTIALLQTILQARLENAPIVNVSFRQMASEFQSKVVLPSFKSEGPMLFTQQNEVVRAAQRAASAKSGEAIKGLLWYFRDIYYRHECMIAAIEEIIKLKKQLQTERGNLASQKKQLGKLSSGKTTFKSIFRSGSKEAQAQEITLSSQRLETQIQIKAKMLNLVIGYLQNFEIPNLRTYKKAGLQEALRKGESEQKEWLSVLQELGNQSRECVSRLREVQEKLSEGSVRLQE